VPPRPPALPAAAAKTPLFFSCGKYYVQLAHGPPTADLNQGQVIHFWRVPGDTSA